MCLGNVQQIKIGPATVECFCNPLDVFINVSSISTIYTVRPIGLAPQEDFQSSQDI